MSKTHPATPSTAKPAKGSKTAPAAPSAAPALSNKPGAAPMAPPAPPAPPAPTPPDDQDGQEPKRGTGAKGKPQEGNLGLPTLALLIPSPFVEKEGLGPYISHRVDLQARDLNAEEKAGLELVIKAYHGKATGDWRKVASNNPQCFRLLLRDIARAGKVAGSAPAAD